MYGIDYFDTIFRGGASLNIPPSFPPCPLSVRPPRKPRSGWLDAWPPRWLPPALHGSRLPSHGLTLRLRHNAIQGLSRYSADDAASDNKHSVDVITHDTSPADDNNYPLTVDGMVTYDVDT